MNRPNFLPIFTKKSDFCEVSDSEPVKEFIPNQAITLKELVSRFERGQRLNVHANFAPGANFESLTDEEAALKIANEDINSSDFPDYGINDIADVECAYYQHVDHKADFARRKKEAESQQATSKKAPQDDATSVESNPSK